MDDLNMEGMAVAPGVVETIISIAVKDVEGVASIGGSVAGGLLGIFNSRNSSQGIEVTADGDKTIAVAVRIEVYGGYALPEVAAQIRKAVAEAVSSQVGLTCSSVDVYIDSIHFSN